VIFPGAEIPVADLMPGKNDYITAQSEAAGLALIQQLNKEHAHERPGDSRLDARIKSYELAARMQLAAPEALELSGETKETLRLYGLDHGKSSFDAEINPIEEADAFGRKCLVARRLLERGVRFVQIWHGAGQPWDSHDDIEVNHRRLAKECDQAIGALLDDLVGLGLLESTLVLWGGEFGRTPTVELPQPGTDIKEISGRDHNHHGFSVWMAGGGVKGGTAYGATDELGFKAVDKPVHVHDLQATLLHCLGLDHTRLTFRHSGRDFRLTDIHGRVIEEWLA
jgi:uncharacterized protein (DUF1501 family)